ncbi:penicillin acylase family protein [Siccirubricoccus sp. G192]|uniref:penicillin acylase family protein n=1 Tax=Siccirubricoccus sp. G192 TaxID=2849651 RepID=UPI001C2BB85B|nr:penicillin acylase family protein [Siccirubricoccus sp. G192]MBV1798821.1 penicillin acylase family protein [Siccirubricoccus sp. G192]
MTAWRWLRRGLLALTTLLLLGLAGALGLAWWSLPARDQVLRLPGLSAPVEITLDAQGVPRIAAATERDATMALGWLHARDRLFQMEMMRRGASGRLAEIGGAGLLRSDRFVRVLGLARRAREDFATLPAEARDSLEAYAAGVNAWIAARGRFAAPGFLALGKPEPWAPEHSLLWAKVMGLWLSGNWRVELDRARLAGILPPERMAELWPEDASAGRPDAALVPAVEAGHLARLAAALPRFPEPGTLPDSASNAWAVAGSRSSSGAPLLANDPHLGFQAPILWYLARIDLADGRMLAGATSPGVPLMVIGRNRHLAWGFTTTHSDTQDVFVERLAGPDAYQTPDGPRPFTVTEEVIRVRGAEPVVLRVRETRHGPVISDLDPARPDDTVLAVAMANLTPGDSAAAGLLALNRSGSLAEARKAAALITSPSQNLMLADAAGGIAMLLTGRTPLRRAGDGTLPAPGWDGSHDWTGWVPWESLPHVTAPNSGALVNANNRVAPPGYPVFLGHDWFGDWRFRRIGQMLGARPTHAATDFAAMQMDTLSLLARELLLPPDAMLRALPRPEGAAGAARDLLLDWDGNISPDLPQPLIFNAWVQKLGEMALAAGGVPEGAWTARANFIRFVLAPDGRGAAWCGGDCPGLAARALAEAIAGLQASQGADPAAWRWGAVHRARFEHPLLRFIPGLGALTRLEAVTGGDEWTVFRGGFRGAGAANPWAHVHGPGLRLVADLADPDRTLAMIATGQSGHPLSPHWGDLLRPWREGGMLVLGRQAEAVAGRLRLNP